MDRFHGTSEESGMVNFVAGLGFFFGGGGGGEGRRGGNFSWSSQIHEAETNISFFTAVSPYNTQPHAMSMSGTDLLRQRICRSDVESAHQTGFLTQS